MALVSMTASGLAQKPSSRTNISASNEDAYKGLTEVETFQGTINSESNILKLDSTLGYDFNQHFGLFAGVPLYFAHVNATATTPSSSHNGLGNAYVGFLMRAPNPALNYAGAVTVSAPTGSTSNGFSSGRAGVDWTNRLDRSFDRLTPFFEGGLANTVPDSVFFTRPFTSLGAITHLQEGAEYVLVRHFSAGASVYQIVPFGNQKIFSKLVTRGQVGGPGRGRSGRVFATSATASGNDLTRENGFSTWVGLEPTAIWRVELGYTRSATFDLNSFAFNVRMNVGKMLRSKKNP